MFLRFNFNFLHKEVQLILKFLDELIREIIVSVLLCQMSSIYWITRIGISLLLAIITVLFSITIKINLFDADFHFSMQPSLCLIFLYAPYLNENRFTMFILDFTTQRLCH